MKSGRTNNPSLPNESVVVAVSKSDEFRGHGLFFIFFKRLRSYSKLEVMRFKPQHELRPGLCWMDTTPWYWFSFHLPPFKGWILSARSVHGVHTGQVGRGFFLFFYSFLPVY